MSLPPALLFILFLCVCLPTQALHIRTQKSLKDHHYYQARNQFKIPLTRDDSVQRKMNLFNFFSQQSAVHKQQASFVSLSYDKDTQIASQETKQNLFTTQSEFQSFMQVSRSRSNSIGSNHLPLKNHANTFYTGSIGVGKKEDWDKYKMIFDTGSTLIFLNSLKCKDVGCVRGNQFDSKQSKSFTAGDMEVEVNFGSGTIIGETATDKFYVANMEVKDVQFIEITREIGYVFEDGDFDGLVGLSFPELTEGVDTLVDTMKQQNLISHKQMSFYMSRRDGSRDSFVSFGEIDKNVIEGEVKYHKVKSPLYWTLLAEQILLGGKDTQLCSAQKPCALAIDSGTSIVAGPTDAINTIIDLIEDAKIPCNQMKDMPALTFVIDGTHYSLMGQEYMISLQESLIPNFFEHSNKSSAIHCEPQLLKMDMQEDKYGDLWILGDLFMSKYYTVFNREDKTVGFAKLKSFDHSLYAEDEANNKENTSNSKSFSSSRITSSRRSQQTKDMIW